MAVFHVTRGYSGSRRRTKASWKFR